MPEKIIKPKIGDKISEVLSGNVLNSALDLINYLNNIKMTPQWSATNVWKVSYKTFSVCFIRL